MSQFHHASDFLHRTRQHHALGHRPIERVSVAFVDHPETWVANDPVLADDALEIAVEIDHPSSLTVGSPWIREYPKCNEEPTCPDIPTIQSLLICI